MRLHHLKEVIVNESGTVLLESKVLMVVSVSMILLLGSLMIPWIKDYFTDYSDSVENAGKNSQFRSVTIK
ncbi:hypothetical protein EEL30_00680 (plasmid) [Brevibacillus laterosporus]|uniref:Uncharacterized protein n=1 Tax=Brevibacillus laterosporus TaxID=1465 RepID=A0A518V1Z9_BRELA|nr:hypothetical protein EEL30_00680 [Brevibacillus laterosporus]